jgi:hypothetical protein
MSPLRAKDADERTSIQLDGACRTRLFDEPAEQIEMLAIRSAILDPSLSHSETGAERDELVCAPVAIQITDQMRAESRRQACATRPILRMVEVNHLRLQDNDYFARSAWKRT